MVPGERQTGMACLIEEKPFWPKPFCDLSLATMLALEWVSVINDLRGNEGMLEQRKSSQEIIVQQYNGALVPPQGMYITI